MSNVGLMSAVLVNDLKRFNYLLHKNHPDEIEIGNALNLAAEEGRIEIVKSIINDDEAFNKLSNGPRFYLVETVTNASIAQNPECLKALVENNRFFNAVTSIDPTVFRGAMDRAAEAGLKENLEFLENNKKITAQLAEPEVAELDAGYFRDEVLEKLNELGNNWRVKEIEGQEYYSTMFKVAQPGSAIFSLNDCLDADIPMPRIKDAGHINIPLDKITPDNIAKLDNFYGKQYMEPSKQTLSR